MHKKNDNVNKTYSYNPPIKCSDTRVSTISQLIPTTRDFGCWKNNNSYWMLIAGDEISNNEHCSHLRACDFYNLIFHNILGTRHYITGIVTAWSSVENYKRIWILWCMKTMKMCIQILSLSNHSKDMWLRIYRHAVVSCFGASVLVTKRL